MIYGARSLSAFALVMARSSSIKHLYAQICCTVSLLLSGLTWARVYPMFVEVALSTDATIVVVDAGSHNVVTSNGNSRACCLACHTLLL